MKFGDFLKELRNRKGWTQPEAATQSGIEQSYLSKLENGKAWPSEEVFDRLREAYDLDIDDLCEKISDPELEKMREVAAVRAALQSRMHKARRAHRRGLLLGAVFFVLGSGMLAHWYWLEERAAALTLYIYESKGVVLEGESPYLFNVMPSSREMAHLEGLAYDRFFGTARDHSHRQDEQMTDIYRQRLELRERLDYQQVEFASHRGDMYIEPAGKGSRTWVLVDERRKDKRPDTGFEFIFGIMSLVAGIFSFVVGARWR